MYINFNDYHLLYLIKEGNEKALECLFNKYKFLIWKVILNYSFSFMQDDDLLQEGLITLNDCIKSYNDNIKISFYSYFYISLKRRFNKIKFKDRCSKNIKLAEDYNYNNKLFYNYIILDIKYEYPNDIYTIKMFEECIINNISIKSFSKKYNIDYRKARYKYNKLLDFLKNIITNYI